MFHFDDHSTSKQEFWYLASIGSIVKDDENLLSAITQLLASRKSVSFCFS